MYMFFALLYLFDVRNFFAIFISNSVMEVNRSKSWQLLFLLLMLINLYHPDLAIVSILRSSMNVMGAPLSLHGVDENIFRSAKSLLEVLITLWTLAR